MPRGGETQPGRVAGRGDGTLRRAPRDKLASMKSTLTPTLSPETTRKKGSEAVGTAKGAPEPYGVFRIPSRWATNTFGVFGALSRRRAGADGRVSGRGASVVASREQWKPAVHVRFS